MQKYFYAYAIVLLIAICLVVYMNPVEKMMQSFPRHTFYYRKSDIKTSDKKEVTNLYDVTLTKVLGTGLYNVSLFETESDKVDIEYGTFCVSDVDAIHFTTFSKNDSGFFKSGKYTYSINGGSGKFAGAKGYVVFNVNDDLRKVEVYMA